MTFFHYWEKRPVSCPYIMEGQIRNGKRGDKRGTSQPLQLYRGAAGQHHRDAAAQLSAVRESGGQSHRYDREGAELAADD